MTTATNPIANVLQSIDREVWIVTASSHGKRGGLCATWVSQASLDPANAVMLIGIAPNHFTAELIDASSEFVLHLLREEQTEFALRFATGSSRHIDKFVGLTVEPNTTRLSDCLAWLACKVFARYDAGDRIFYWADVIAGEQLSSGKPLREKQLFAAASPEVKQTLLANRNEDIALHRPLHELWRNSNRFEAKLD